MKQFLIILLYILSFWGDPNRALADEAQDENAVSATAKLLPYQIEPTQNVTLEIDLEISEGYSTYAEMYELTLKTPGSGFKLGKFYINPVKTFFDETSKKKRDGVIGKAVLKAPLEAPEILGLQEEKLEFFLTYQACTKNYCLFPKTIELTSYFKWNGPKSVTNKVSHDLSFISNLKALNVSELFKTKGMPFVLLSLFFLGILTSLSPCVYPLIPITLATLGRESHSRNKLQNFLAANLYVLGMSLTYAALGVVAASSGLLFGSFTNSPWVLGIVCLVFLSMSLSSFGLFEIQMPSRLQFNLQTKEIGTGYTKVFFTGLVAGLIAGPCVGPILVGVLTFISQTQDLWLGFWSLFAFALGMGQLLLIIGLSGGLVKLLPKSGPWMNAVKYLFGIILLGMFYYYFKMLVPNRVWEGALGLGLLILGSFFYYSIQKPEKPLFFVAKGISMAIFLFGVFLLFWSIMSISEHLSSNKITIDSSISRPPKNNLAMWKTYSDEDFKDAISSGRPIIIDFYADWCASCHELEEKTFNDPEFLSLTRDFVLLRYDATEDSDQLRKLKAKYKIVGLPTLVFYDKKGRLRSELQVNEFITTEQFKAIFQAL
jgi:thiol:disulfide interchange protein DsbD